MHLTQSLHRNVQQQPNGVATIFGDRVRTFAESEERIAKLAGALMGLGVTPGDRVGILAANSDRYHEYYYAVPWIGAAVTPVNIRWSPTEIVYSLDESDTQILFVDDMFAPMIPAVREGFPGIRAIIFCGDGDLPNGCLDYETLLEQAEPVPDTETGYDALAGVFYTGGTTGFPKGVMLSHRNLLTSAMGSATTGHFLTPAGRLLHAAPMFHLADMASWVAGNLMGVTHVIIPFFTPEGVARAISEHRTTDALLVPTMIQMLVDDPATAKYDLSCQQNVTYGASPISSAVLDRAQRTFPNASFTQAYGMTEVAPVATLLLPDDHKDPVLRTSAGRAAPHAEVKIVGPDDVEVPRGEVGEVVVRGDHVMLGYWNQPDATAAAVRNGWMHTGDGGRMDDHGYVFIVDRIKDMIVTGGENVYSVEVENAVASHPGVAAVAVIGIPDDRWGERVHAVIVRMPDASITDDELQAHTRALIANYKVPRSFSYVDELPKSGAGKVLKRELRKQFWDSDRQVH